MIEQLFPSATISDIDCIIDEAANITDDEKSESEIIETLKTLIQDIYPEKIPTESVNENSCLLETLNRYVTLRESLKCYRTAKLWIQYMEMVDILKVFIKAERTGNWDLHLKTMKCMLPYFAAAGHYLYLKSGYFYL